LSIPRCLPVQFNLLARVKLAVSISPAVGLFFLDSSERNDEDDEEDAQRGDATDHGDVAVPDIRITRLKRTPGSKNYLSIKMLDYHGNEIVALSLVGFIKSNRGKKTFDTPF